MTSLLTDFEGNSDKYITTSIFNSQYNVPDFLAGIYTISITASQPRIHGSVAEEIPLRKNNTVLRQNVKITIWPTS